MSNNIYCTYLTVYSGNKLPPFYIGSTSVERINKGYHGSVSSKRYKDIWKFELKNNSNLFKTHIISTHKTREEALEKELFLQEKLNVINSAMYINQSYAKKDGYFGVSIFGKDHQTYGCKLSDEHKRKIARYNHDNHSFGKKWYYNTKTLEHIRCHIEDKPENYIEGMCIKRKSQCDKNNPMFGKRHTTETKLKMSESARGSKNGSYGRRWFYHPETLENIKCLPEDKPENYISGRNIR